MKMPPPVPRRHSPPPPKASNPKAWYGEEPEWPPVAPELSRFDLEAAIWIHGGYPRAKWPDAARALLRKCRAETPFDNICAAAIYFLDKQLHDAPDLTYKGMKAGK